MDGIRVGEHCWQQKIETAWGSSQPRARLLAALQAALLMALMLLQGCGLGPETSSARAPGGDLTATPAPTETSAETPTETPTGTLPSATAVMGTPTDINVVLEQLVEPVAPASPLTRTNSITTATEVTDSGVISDRAALTTTETSTETSTETIALSITASVTVSTMVSTTEPISAPLSPLATPAGAVAGLVPTPTPMPTPQPTESAPPAPTPDGTARAVNVPILMYHYLSTPPADADIYRQDLSVAPALFAAQLDAIEEAGYTTISLYALHEHLMLGTPLPPNPVVITFDDGYRDNYENALPLLRERGMTATFFVVTDFMDEERPAYLTWEMARAMRDAGMDIESHGRNHVTLSGQGIDYLVWQALGSRETIEYELGVRPRFVSYPAGEFDELTKEIFQSAGYWAGFTTRQGATHSSEDDLFELRRVRVRGSTTPEALIRLLALDW